MDHFFQQYYNFNFLSVNVTSALASYESELQI